MNPQQLRVPRPTTAADLSPANHAALEGLADLVERCTAFRPEDRPDSAAILRCAMHLLVRRDPVLGWVRRRPALPPDSTGPSHTSIGAALHQGAPLSESYCLENIVNVFFIF
jgi:hypothetical protein